MFGGGGAAGAPRQPHPRRWLFLGRARGDPSCISQLHLTTPALLGERGWWAPQGSSGRLAGCMSLFCWRGGMRPRWPDALCAGAFPTAHGGWGEAEGWNLLYLHCVAGCAAVGPGYGSTLFPSAAVLLNSMHNATPSSDTDVPLARRNSSVMIPALRSCRQRSGTPCSVPAEDPPGRLKH